MRSARALNDKLDVTSKDIAANHESDAKYSEQIAEVDKKVSVGLTFALLLF